ncbi:hypothetical protein NQ318_002950 [Aromia moschata]|uniref:Peptidase A2 domain-containing protein n=1 Tax=Aromia moschata TaxID=1265417 RepID=A0AAV8X7J2_9CUCU|nr:hypothetical protein NQ318_002950 [Aromia moschata]
MYIDTGSSCTNITKSEADKLNLDIDQSKIVCIRGYGNAAIKSLGTVTCTIKVDDVECEVDVNVVPDSIQDIPLLVGRSFTEQPHVKLAKDYATLTLTSDVRPENPLTKVALLAKKTTVIPPNHLCNVPVYIDTTFRGDVYVEASLRLKEDQEHCLPRVVLTITDSNSGDPVMPVINLSDRDILIKERQLIARAWTCQPEEELIVKVMTIKEKEIPELPLNDIVHGPITDYQPNHPKLTMIVMSIKNMLLGMAEFIKLLFVDYYGSFQEGCGNKLCEQHTTI